MADEFTRDHFRWLLQVSEDSAIPATGFKLAFHFGQHFNRETGEAWPSQRTLAGLVGVSARSIRTLTDLLVERGHLEVRPHRGPNSVNVYRAKRKSASAAIDEQRKPASGSENGEAEVSFRTETEQRKFGAREAEVCDRSSGSQLPTNYLEPLQNLKSRSNGWKEENGTWTVPCESEAGRQWERQRPSPARSARTDCFINLPNQYPANEIAA